MRALDAWKAAGGRGIAEVVTGGGKTIFSGLCMQAALAQGSASCFLVLVPTIALLDQWYVSLREDFGVPESQVTVWSARKARAEQRRVTLMVMNSARRAVAGLQDLEKTMLVVDECHRAGSVVNSLALQHPFACTLGISATPDSEFDSRLATVLEPHLGDVIIRYGLDEASRDGILSPFDLVNVRFALMADEQAEYDKWTGRIVRVLRRAKGAEVDADVLRVLLRRRAAVSAKARMRVPLAVRLIEQHRGTRTMVFHESVSEAERLCQMLRERGHSATIYHSRISGSVRRDNLRLFRKGAFDVLITCRALDEGVNIPEVQVAVVASSTASARQRIQRLGRVLRPAHGKDRALIYTLFATKAEEDRLLKEAAQMEGSQEVSWRETRLRRG